MPQKMKEDFYYDELSDKVKCEFKCFEVKKRVGTEDVGTVDIAGVRDIGGHSSGQIELIVFEVKKAHEKKEAMAHFGKLIGQTLAYSIISHRCYMIGLFLPTEKGFSDEQKIIANHFGVGLIEAQLDRNGKIIKEFKEVLTSKHFEPPIHHKLDKVLWNLGVAQCCICGIYFRERQLKMFIIGKEELDREYLFSGLDHKKMWVCGTCSTKFNFKQRARSIKKRVSAKHKPE